MMNTSSLNKQYDEVYCYPYSSVLVNKFDITNEEEFSAKERVATTEKEILMYNNPIKGNFDLEHLQKIHEYMFNDIYTWAGKLRTINIYKGGTKFCPYDEITDKAKEIFNFIKEHDFFIGEDNNKKIEYLAKTIGDINTLHPFREGNGRVERQFIFDLALNAGLYLNYSKTKKDNIIEASMQAEYKDYDGFIKIFQKISKPIV